MIVSFGYLSGSGWSSFSRPFLYSCFFYESTQFKSQSIMAGRVKLKESEKKDK